MKILLGILIAASIVVAVAIAGGPILERNRRAGEMKLLRAALDQARIAADSCKVALTWEEEGFLQFNLRVDSLRTLMESFEDPEQGGVPQVEYEAYLRSFEGYNSSVESWKKKAEELRASEAECRVLIEAHNNLGDSIRKVQMDWMANGG